MPIIHRLISIKYLLVFFSFFIATHSYSETSVIKIVKGITINKHVYENETNNLDFSIVIRNTRSDFIVYDAICISAKGGGIPIGNWENILCTQQPSIKIGGGKELDLSDTKTFDFPVGTYTLVAKAQYQGKWFDISPVQGAKNDVSFNIISKPEVSLYFYPKNISFSNQNINTVSDNKFLKLTNNSKIHVNGNISLSGENANSFKLDTNYFSLAAGETTELKIEFSPTRVGVKSAELKISGSGFSEKIYISGEATNNPSSLQISNFVVSQENASGDLLVNINTHSSISSQVDVNIYLDNSQIPFQYSIATGSEQIRINYLDAINKFDTRHIHDVKIRISDTQNTQELTTQVVFNTNNNNSSFEGEKKYLYWI